MCTSRKEELLSPSEMLVRGLGREIIGGVSDGGWITGVCVKYHIQVCEGYS